MFRLTREVRFALNRTQDDQLLDPPLNGFAGFPSLTGFGMYLALRVTLDAEALNPVSRYVRSIRDIDELVRRRAIPLIEPAVDRVLAFFREKLLTPAGG